MQVIPLACGCMLLNNELPVSNACTYCVHHWRCCDCRRCFRLRDTESFSRQLNIFYLWVKSSTPTFLWPAWKIICAERLPRQHSFLKRNNHFKLPPPSPLWLVPCSDHHQVVQEARAHFLFLHLGLRTSCASAHLGSMLPVESVLHSQNSRRASGGKLRLLAVHRCAWKKNREKI